MAANREQIEPPAKSGITHRGGDAPGEWWRLTSAGAAALVIGLGFLWLLKLLAWPLALLLGGVALAAGLNPVVGWLEKWLPRTAAVIALYLLFVILVVALVWITIPPLVAQVDDLSARMPSLIEAAQERIGRWIPLDGLSVQDLLTPLSQIGGSGGDSVLLALPRRLVEWMTALVVVVFVSFYALILAPAAERFLLSLYPEQGRERVERVVDKMMAAMGGFVRGTMIDALVVGVLTYIGLLAIGFPFELVLSVLAGLLEIVPVVGPFITALVLVAVALLEAPGKLVIIIVFALVLQQLESNLLVPNIMREQAKVSPLLTLLALLTGERIGGLVGALVAIPLVAGLRVLVVEVVAPAIRRWTGAPAVSREETAGIQASPPISDESDEKEN